MKGEARAPAKVNLTLHVTGRRSDGYHTLDSLVAFADTGDRVTVAAAETLSLEVSGPFAASAPEDESNLVLRAARMMRRADGAAIRLEKHLPAAGGIGGGSADAAAVLRVLCGLWGVALPDAVEAIGLGADVPVCLAGRVSRMRGIGEELAEAPRLPTHGIVLVHPGAAAPTAEVYARLGEPANAPMPAELPRTGSARGLAVWLGTQRNDLEAPAQAVAPAIGAALGALAAQRDCLLARMSGSGATCFGLFETRAVAERAAGALAAGRPGWWVRAATLS